VSTALPPAAEAALAELERAKVRHEVFAKEGETWTLRWRGGQWERRHAHQAGVACRLAGGGRRGFAAIAGTAATAGRDAARAALASAYPGPDPLPPRALLGGCPVPPSPPPPSVAEAEHFAAHLADAIACLSLRIEEIRVVTGWSRTLLVTGEGFAGTASVGGALVDVRASQGELPATLVHHAVPALSEAVAARLVEVVDACAGHRLPAAPPQAGLWDVLLAPEVAAHLLLALLDLLGAQPRRRRHVSPAWHLVDARCGPEGLLPLPFDGEGIPSRRVELVAGGRLGNPALTWEDAAGMAGRAGGAVRASYADPPTSGPANLVMGAGTASPKELAAAMSNGWHLRAVAGPVQLDRPRDRLVLPALGVRLRGGDPVQVWPRVELRAGCGRLLAALQAAGGDPASASLRAAVTTPSLLFRQLELG